MSLHLLVVSTGSHLQPTDLEGDFSYTVDGTGYVLTSEQVFMSKRTQKKIPLTLGKSRKAQV